MQNIKESLFDPIAETYYALTPPIPQQYISLLQKTFAIKPSDRIIDLGCGSGDLALSLAHYSSFVEGIDISQKMVEMAEEKDTGKQVTWKHTAVEDFDLGEEQYNLILSFDSFHIFSNPVEVIKRCAKALRPGGALCIGWVMYAFDPPLRSAIEETFAAYGMPWDDWGAWTCPTFPDMVRGAQAGLSSPQKKHVGVPARRSTQTILRYFFNVSKTASLPDKTKQQIAQELEKRIAAVYPSGESVGNDHYFIAYCRKQ